MSKIYKALLAIIIVSSISFNASAQQNYWASRTDVSGINTDKAVARVSYPKEFKVFNLDISPLKQELFSIVDHQAKHSTIISLPNADGAVEQFEVFEASNFEPALQAKFPQIRAFSGRGITDKNATLKLSISPQGIQTMVFRTDGKPNEYIEPYSADHTVYSVFRSQRNTGGAPWVCSTPDQQLAAGLNNQVNRIESNAGQLKTLRLAQSCNGEYSNYFGATSAADVILVLAAFNATLTRCNGCYEKDLAVHLNLIAATTAVIYYNPATDPYTTLANWNGQLQNTLTANIGEANYDIGHMFGASGGGGNAGCIGCVCVNGQKGSGITSPADGIPMGDNFDIDYVVHEVGHQLGANHTFSNSNEGTGVNKEVGSGITIMGYAGITAQDVAPHSIAIFHEASIQQIQTNLAAKTCPVTTPQAGINATPVVAALTNYTIPISTPFALTGSATDADAGDVLTYCWEQNDDGGGQTGGNSIARENKPTGPNWLSFLPSTSPTRLMPRLSTILTGANFTGPLAGGDAGVNIEALSNVARTLNFRLTVRDNRPYDGTAVGQTNFQDMAVTVNAATGPFLITSQNSAVSYEVGSSQTVTWSVNGTTGAPINCANVKISLSTDGGNTFSIVLAASTANDGSESITIPANLTTTGRIKVEAIGNIFFDINNASITIIAPTTSAFGYGTFTPATITCPASATMNVTVPITSIAGYSQPVTLSAISGVPAGTTVSFGTNPVTPGNNTIVTLNNANTLAPGTYNVTIQGNGASAPLLTTVIPFTVNAGSGPAITAHPASQVVCAGGSATFSVTATGALTYQWQIAKTCGGVWINLVGETGSSYTISPVNTSLAFRCIVTGQCGISTSNCAALTIAIPAAVTTNPTSQSVCAGSSVTFTAAGSGTPTPTYKWQVSTPAVPTFTDIPGETSPSYTIASTTVAMSGNQYLCVVSNSCATVNTTAATLTVSSSITITSNPTDKSVCEASTTSFTVGAAGSGLQYQWEVSVGGGGYTAVTNNATYSGALTSTLTINNIPASLNGNRYRAVVANGGSCAAGVSTGALLTISTLPVVTSHPQSLIICEGAGTTFSVSATTAVGSLGYQWQFNNGSGYTNIAGATNSTFVQTNVPVGQNAYLFRAAVTAGCGTVNSNPAVLTVNAYPVIAFTPPSTVCASDPALTLSATPGSGAFTGTGVTGTTFTPSVAGIGTKTVTYSVSNSGCQSTAARVILVNDCVERHLTLEQFQSVFVYPNPNNGNFKIRMNTDLYTKLNIKIFDALGRLVNSEIATGLTYGSVISLQLSNTIAPNRGVYHIFLSNDERGTISKRGTSIIVTK